MKPERNERIKLIRINDKSFVVKSQKDEVLIDSNDEYFIYMADVKFTEGKLIEGTYLGELTKESSIIDRYCKYAEIDENNFIVDDRSVKSASMVAVNNKENIIIILSD